VIQSGRLGARANAPLGVVVAVAGFACSVDDGGVNASIAGAIGQREEVLIRTRCSNPQLVVRTRSRSRVAG
jgi:hypothetical protein